jgi:hypothetical protein
LSWAGTAHELSPPPLTSPYELRSACGRRQLGVRNQLHWPLTKLPPRQREPSSEDDPILHLQDRADDAMVGASVCVDWTDDHETRPGGDIRGVRGLVPVCAHLQSGLVTVARRDACAGRRGELSAAYDGLASALGIFTPFLWANLYAYFQRLPDDAFLKATLGPGGHFIVAALFRLCSCLGMFSHNLQ